MHELGEGVVMSNRFALRKPSVGGMRSSGSGFTLKAQRERHWAGPLCEVVALAFRSRRLHMGLPWFLQSPHRLGPAEQAGHSACPLPLMRIC
jgi:hypothetical protein